MACIAEFPQVQRLVQRYQSKGDKVSFLSINIEPFNNHEVPALLEHAHFTVTTLNVPDEKWQKEKCGVDGYGIYILDPELRLMYKAVPLSIYNIEDVETIEKMIDEMLARASANPRSADTDKRRGATQKQ